MCIEVFFGVHVWSRTVPSVLSSPPGLSPYLPPQDNHTSSAEREPSLRSLIGVTFSGAWRCSSPCPGLSGAGPVVGWGGRGYKLCGEMICSPASVPLGSPTVTHGTPVTRSFHCCGTTGGEGLIIRREDILKKILKEKLIYNCIYSQLTRFFITSRVLSFSRVDLDLKWAEYDSINPSKIIYCNHVDTALFPALCVPPLLFHFEYVLIQKFNNTLSM